MDSMRAKLIRSYKLTTLEKILAVVLLGIGIGMYIMIQRSSWFSNSASVINNPGFFPQIVAVGFVLMSILLFLSSLNKARSEMVTINWFGVLIVTVWVLFGILCEYIGFVLSGILALTATLVLFGVKSKKVLILTGILAPVILYLMLGVLLGVKLPTLFL